MARKPNRSSPADAERAQLGGAIPPALKAFAASRTQAVADRIAAAIAFIENEIRDCDGLYPHNSGRLTAAEVCRRAGVKGITLHGGKHKHTTRVKVMNFVKAAGGVTKATRSQRTGPVDTLPTARQRLEAIAQAYHTDMLRMIDLEARVRDLEAENATLKDELALSQGSNVLPFSGRRGA